MHIISVFYKSKSKHESKASGASLSFQNQTGLNYVSASLGAFISAPGASSGRPTKSQGSPVFAALRLNMLIESPKLVLAARSGAWLKWKKRIWHLAGQRCHRCDITRG